MSREPLELLECQSDDLRQQAFAIRYEVFVVEQQVAPDIERDAFDTHCDHFLARVDGTNAGAARIVRDGDTARLGRLAVRKTYRRQGVGHALVRYVEKWAETRGVETLTLHAQARAQIFWASLGYREQGAPFMEADMPHVEMVKELEPGQKGFLP